MAQDRDLARRERSVSTSASMREIFFSAASRLAVEVSASHTPRRTCPVPPWRSCGNSRSTRGRRHSGTRRARGPGTPRATRASGRGTRRGTISPIGDERADRREEARASRPRREGEAGRRASPRPRRWTRRTLRATIRSPGEARRVVRRRSSTPRAPRRGGGGGIVGPDRRVRLPGPGPGARPREARTRTRPWRSVTHAAPSVRSVCAATAGDRTRRPDSRNGAAAA